MQTLVAFQAYVAEKYAPKTAKMYWGDVRELSIYLRNKQLKDISSHDLQQWIGSLVSPTGKGIERKTVNRKVSAIITYFLWLQGVGAITRDPTVVLNNARIQSPHLPGVRTVHRSFFSGPVFMLEKPGDTVSIS